MADQIKDKAAKGSCCFTSFKLIVLANVYPLVFSIMSEPYLTVSVVPLAISVLGVLLIPGNKLLT